MKKNILLFLVVLACMFFHILVAGAQTYPNSNQPVGNIINGADGVIYGSFSSKDNDGNLISSTVYKYNPGDISFTPIMRSETKEMAVQFVDDNSGSLFGVQKGYTGAAQTTSEVFRAGTDGTGLTVLVTSNIATSGRHSIQVLNSGKLYGIRTGGGTNGAGVFYSIDLNGANYAERFNFESEIERPSQVIIHQDVPGYFIDFWGPAQSAGPEGKGAIFVIYLGEESTEGYHMVDFKGTGAPQEEGYADNSETPLSILQGIDVNTFVPTTRGGAYDAGTIFNLSGDGNWITHDFTPQYGNPSAVITIDQYDGKLFGYGGAPGSIFIYEIWRRFDEFNIIAIFNSSNPVDIPVSLIAAPDTLLYGTARTSDLSPNGAFFSLNHDGSDFKVLFHFDDFGTSSFLINPSDGASNISAAPDIEVQSVAGATQYIVQLSPSSDFSSVVMTDTITGTHGHLEGLSYSTTYYTRVKPNNGGEYGQVTSFTTGATDVDSYVIDPVDGAVHLPLNNTSVTANNIPGATTYTIELNTASDFTGTSVVKTSSIAGERTFTFSGLPYFTVYYSRVKTNLSGEWGPTRHFTTIGEETYLILPVDGATGVPAEVLIQVYKQGASEYDIEFVNNSTGFIYVDHVQAEWLTPEYGQHFNSSTTFSVRVKADNNPNYGRTSTFTTRPINEEAYVIDPPDGATGIITSPAVTAHRIANATSYTVELSPNPNFTGPKFSRTVTGYQSEYIFNFSGLARNTKYYSRAKTNFSSLWGPTKSFTTHPVEDTYVISPADKSFDVSINPTVRLTPVPGATLYTLELARNPEFTGDLIIKTSSTPEIKLTNLDYYEWYYTRAKTNLSTGYSFQTRFTTIQPTKYLFVSNPVDGAMFVQTNNLKVTANAINGATTYTIELSTHPFFYPEVTIQKSSAVPGQRTMIFNGLAEATKYYSRVSTNISGTGPARTFTTTGTTSFVTQPSNNDTNVSYYPTVKLKPVTGATEYTLEISTTPDFSGDVLTYTTASTTLPKGNVLLEYTTTYYARVRTNISLYGQVTKFTTQAINTFAFVSSPVNGATNVAYHNLKVTANEVYNANFYTIELNTSPDFTGTSIVKSSPVYNSRTMIFELTPSTTYYNRIRTNAPTDWGPVRSFTTASPGAPPALVEVEQPSARIFPNPFKKTFTIVSQSIEQEKTIVSLIDATGRELYKTEITEGQSLELGEDLTSGLYLLKLEQGSTVKTHRIIKNR